MAESNLRETIRRLNETANMDVGQWVASRDWLGRYQKELQVLEEELREIWNLGRNVILEWAMLEASVQVLAVPQYVLAAGDELQQSLIKQILLDTRCVELSLLESHAASLDYDTIEIPLGVKSARLSLPQLTEMMSRFGPTYRENQAVALFDIVEFSLLTPLEQVAQLNSLSYSLNSAHARMLSRKEDISFARSTTGDGFYVWNRDSSIQANINLYHFMHLALADNAIARSKSTGRIAPRLRAAFHVGSYYEFKQSEGLHPVSSSFVVGDVTIELARMVEHTKPGQVLVGDFLTPMTTPGLEDALGDSPRSVSCLNTVQFIEQTQETLSSLEGLVLSGDRINAIRCYLTGDRDGDTFTVRRYTIIDKHGLSRDAYNAKINIYREQSDPIFLGLQDMNV